MEFVAVGSVVQLKSTKEQIDIVIIGRMLQSPQGEVYEYAGVVYPYGYVGGNDTIMFKHEDIGVVVYEGYVNQKEEEYNKELVKVKNKN